MDELSWSHYDPPPDDEFLEAMAYGDWPEPEEFDIDDARAAATALPAPKDPAALPDAKWKLVTPDAAFSSQLPPVDWLIESLDLAIGRPMGLWGAPGSGKNVLAQLWGLIVASGTPCGPWATDGRPRRVIHVTYDMGRYATALKYRQLANGLGLKSTPDITISAHPEINLCSERAISRFAKLLKDYDLCILDNLRNATPGADENKSEFGAHVSGFGAAAEDAGCVALYLHHTKKGASIGLDAARGSGAVLGASGPIWMIGEASRDQPRELHHLRAHDTATGFKDPLVVGLKQSNGDGFFMVPHTHYSHAIMTVSAKEAKARAPKPKADSNLDAICKAIKKAGRPMTSNELVDACSLRRVIALSLLREGMSTGRLTMEDGPRNSQLYSLPGITGSETDRSGNRSGTGQEPVPEPVD